MAKPFEVRAQVEVEVTPEQAWEAISTGPGIDSWFMGETEIEPRQGGTARTSLPGFTMESTVTVWDPPHRLVLETPTLDDGRFMAFEYVVESQGGGKTLLRLVHSGFLPDDEWEAEYDALKVGDPMYVRKLGEYLTHFRGQTATPISAFGPQVDRDRAWSTLTRALGVKDDAAIGEPVSFAPEGLPPIDGVVDEVSHETLGVRTSDGIYRFIHGLGGAMVLGHHIFAPIDRPATEQAWQSWLNQTFAQAAS
jgi:uncharacterized protein YndB with AHSA1/START domain